MLTGRIKGNGTWCESPDGAEGQCGHVRTAECPPGHSGSGLIFCLVKLMAMFISPVGKLGLTVGVALTLPGYERKCMV